MIRYLDPFFTCLLRLQECPPYSPFVYCLHPRRVEARYSCCEVFLFRALIFVSCVNHLKFVKLFKATSTHFIDFHAAFCFFR